MSRRSSAQRLPPAAISSWLLCTALISQNALASLDAQDLPGGLPSKVSASELLTEAYADARNLSTVERCFLLVRLARSGARLNDPRLSSWVDQIFREAATLPESWNVAAMRKNALVALASIDADRALNILGGLSFSHVTPGDVPAEDLRADAAREIFRIKWRQTRDLKPIESIAAKIGDSGQYPFLAVAPILLDSAKSTDRSSAQRLFSSALSYFRKGDTTQRATSDFVTFLLLVDGSVPKEMMLAALHAVDARLNEFRRTENFQGIIESPGGISIIQSRREYLLSQLLPLMHKLDAQWAAKLTEGDRALIEPVVSSHTFSSLVTGLPHGTGELAQLHSQNVQRQWLDIVRASLPEDPDGALSKLEFLSDPAIRAEALSEIASQTSDSRPELSDRCRREMEQLMASQSTNPLSLLQMHVSRARVAASRRDATAFFLAFNRGMELGVELLQEQRTSGPPAATPLLFGFEQLYELVGIGARFFPERTISSIRAVTDLPLRASGLISAAERIPTP